jgi:hypothetical protein
MLFPYVDSDPEFCSLATAFVEELHKLGWKSEHNVHFDYRDRMRAMATELASLTHRGLARPPYSISANKDRWRHL